MNLMDSWIRLLKLAYKWGTLPVLLLPLFLGQGWTILRMAPGYAETAGIVTHYSCGKYAVVEFSYTVDGSVHQGKSAGAPSGFECPPFSPGQTVRVYYAASHPDIALMNATPLQALKHQITAILVILFGIIPAATFFMAYKETST